MNDKAESGFYSEGLNQMGIESHLNTSRGSESKRTGSGGQWLKLSDAAQTLGVSEITIRRRVKAGRIEATFKGGRYFVYVPEGATAEDFLDTIAMNPGTIRQGLGPYESSSQHMIQAYPKQSSLSAEAISTARSRTADELGLKGPSSDEIISMLKADLREKQSEIASLRKQLGDQLTLNAALEAALDDAMGEQQ